MDDSAAPSRPHPPRHPALALAIGGTAGLLLALSVLNPRPIADEAGHHLHTIWRFYAGDWTVPPHLPMLPTYHALATLALKVFGPDLFVLRALGAVMAFIAFWLFREIARHRALSNAGDALLHFAWQPLLFPFTVLVYTEMASMLCLVGALYLHVRRWYPASAGVLLLACLVRQSNVVWVVFMACWAVLDLRQTTHIDQPASEAAHYDMARSLARKLLGHFLLVILAGVVLLVARRAPIPTVEANRPRVNVAQFYLFTLFVILIWLPLWMARLGDDWRAIWRKVAGRPWRGVFAGASTLAALVLLTWSFQNPHPWNLNQDYLRNLPLIAMTRSRTVCFAVACLFVLVVPSIVRFTAAQPNWRILTMVWLFSLAYLLPHSLAEPRYYIVPVFFINFFTEYTRSQARVVSLWYLSLCLAIGLVVVSAGNPGGGIW